jgi:hypothetical protein
VESIEHGRGIFATEPPAMLLSIQINYENATFYDDPVSEIACVLAEVVAMLRANGNEQGSKAKLHDTDGSTVGEYVLNVSKGSRP